MKMNNFIVYWVNDRVYVKWVTRTRAESIVARTDTRVTTWLIA